jgi:hypothetical protein
MEGIGILPSFVAVGNIEVPVPSTGVTAPAYSVVELETCTLWPDTPEVMVVVLGANVDEREALDVRLAEGKGDWEARPAMSASSM